MFCFPICTNTAASYSLVWFPRLAQFAVSYTTSKAVRINLDQRSIPWSALTECFISCHAHGCDCSLMPPGRRPTRPETFSGCSSFSFVSVSTNTYIHPSVRPSVLQNVAQTPARTREMSRFNFGDKKSKVTVALIRVWPQFEHLYARWEEVSLKRLMGQNEIVMTFHIRKGERSTSPREQERGPDSAVTSCVKLPGFVSPL